MLPRRPSHQAVGFSFCRRDIRRRTQVVRERSAKPLCGGSNPPGASAEKVLQESGLFCSGFRRSSADHRRSSARRLCRESTSEGIRSFLQRVSTELGGSPKVIRPAPLQRKYFGGNPVGGNPVFFAAGFDGARLKRRMKDAGVAELVDAQDLKSWVL
jgi:hypothetical protein